MRYSRLASARMQAASHSAVAWACKRDPQKLLELRSGESTMSLRGGMDSQEMLSVVGAVSQEISAVLWSQ
jgi:hypothetical protein